MTTAEKETGFRMNSNDNAVYGRGQAMVDQSEALERPVGPHIPTNEEEAHHVDEVFGKTSWQAKTLLVLHSNPVQYTLMGLLLLDVVILFVELFLDSQYPSCFTIVRDAISCCPGTGAVEDDAHRLLGGGGNVATEGTCGGGAPSHRMLEGDSDGYHPVCESGVDTPYCEAGCDEHKYESIHRAHEALFYMTITILSTFLVELCTQIICLTPRVFFTKAFYVLDFIIVSLSFALELFFHASDEGTLQSLVGIIVMARLWRFVRIGHGLVGVTAEYASRKHDKFVKYIDMLEAELEARNAPLPSYRKKIEKLKRLDKSSQHLDGDNNDSRSTSVTKKQLGCSMVDRDSQTSSTKKISDVEEESDMEVWT